MVESLIDYEFKLSSVFLSLSNETRRDMLKKIAKKTYSVVELANLYNISLNAVSKHLKILERASLITKQRLGKFNYIQLSPKPVVDAIDYLYFYKQFWDDKLDALGRYLEKEV